LELSLALTSQRTGAVIEYADLAPFLVLRRASRRLSSGPRTEVSADRMMAAARWWEVGGRGPQRFSSPRAAAWSRAIH